jgi:hypothetical protein
MPRQTARGRTPVPTAPRGYSPASDLDAVHDPGPDAARERLAAAGMEDAAAEPLVLLPSSGRVTAPIAR